MLQVLGADVRPVPAVAYDNPNNYNHQVLYKLLNTFSKKDLHLFIFFKYNACAYGTPSFFTHGMLIFLVRQNDVLKV